MLKTLFVGWAAVLGYMCGYTGYLIYRSHTLREPAHHFPKGQA